ncbi:MAG: hypothetical protein WAX04_14130 [Oscillospiraceae bacterium]
MFKYKKIISLVLMVALFATMGTSVFASDGSQSVFLTGETVQIIGGYDGKISDVIGIYNAQQRELINVRINSSATYDKKKGIQVKVKLYTPGLTTNAKFNYMSGTVDVAINDNITSTAFTQSAENAKTIKTDVDTGVTASSGTKGTVSVDGIALATNALSGGGGFAISYEIKIP